MANLLYGPPTELEIKLAEEIKSSPCMIRFFTTRLGLEITLGRTLTPKEADKLLSKVSSSFPKGRRRNA